MPNKATDSFTLKNNNGVEIKFAAHGGRLISVKVPSVTGEIADVLVGYDTVEEALNGDLFFGALCGRYANRIVKGQYVLDGKTVQLDVNNGPNHLHGGVEGFNQRVWNVEEIDKDGCTSAFKLTLVSPDGDQNYPGELKVKVVYSLNDRNEFKIEYLAETSKPTVINLTSHPYFNLSGDLSKSAEDHLLMLNAKQFTPIDPALETCNGEIADVKGTPMDFTSEKPVSDAVNSSFDQIKMVDGLDHNFVISDAEEGLIRAATLKDPKSGRSLEVYTDQPGIQVYTGNHFDGSEKGKGGAPIDKYCGVALETQIFPNSPNHENYPDAVLRPGKEYQHTCIYKFGF
ncbi:galactose mutarotase [Marinilabiliaceae bacterium ANBcel2]|nr:galactose mutarotase [Marinilabiliaceae bacterium ANBcel2]